MQLRTQKKRLNIIRRQPLKCTGLNREPLNEESPFNPRSPYAAGKLFAHNLTKFIEVIFFILC